MSFDSNGGKGPLRLDEAICYAVLFILAVITFCIILLEVMSNGTIREW
jgi:hypothetical protein